MPTIVKNSLSIKVACFECIRGHRSSSCTHTNKILIEVRKPGRPLNNTASLTPNATGPVASNLQPAYVVFGHSQRQCPDNGVIPQDDWVETEAKPYPKSAASLKADGANPRAARNRVSKTDTKNRSRKGTLSRKGKQRLDQIASSTSSPPEDGQSANDSDPNGTPERTSQPAARKSCCQPDSLAEGSASPSPAVSLTPQQNAIDQHGTLFTASIQRGYGRKVLYDSKYNTMSDEQFFAYIRSLSPADLRAEFPYDEKETHMLDDLPSLASSFLDAEAQDSMGGHHCHDNTARDQNEEASTVHNDSKDGCCCGDDCLCLGCSTHPANPTTLKHVEEATRFMQEDPAYQMDDMVEPEFLEAIATARKTCLQTGGSQHEPALVQAPAPFAHNASSSHQQAPPSSRAPPQHMPWTANYPPSAWSVQAPYGYAGPTALLLTGSGTAQQILPLQMYGGSGQVFVLAPPRPACVDEHGVCQCGPECACDGCQTHKNPPAPLYAAPPPTDPGFFMHSPPFTPSYHRPPEIHPLPFDRAFTGGFQARHTTESGAGSRPLIQRSHSHSHSQTLGPGMSSESIHMPHHVASPDNGFEHFFHSLDNAEQRKTISENGEPLASLAAHTSTHVSPLYQSTAQPPPTTTTTSWSGAPFPAS